MSTPAGVDVYRRPILAMCAMARHAAIHHAHLDPDLVDHTIGPPPTVLSPTHAGLYAAHTIRAHRWGDPEPTWTRVARDRPRDIGSHPPPAGEAGLDLAARRLELAARLRRALVTDRGPAEADMAAEKLTRWLAAAGQIEPRDQGQVVATVGHLCHYVTQLADWRAYRLAWMSTHGAELVAALAVEKDGRGWLRRVVGDLWASGMWTKVELAAAVGVSRPTLDAWLAAGESEPGGIR